MRILITAGDPSADRHAARLMAALRRRVPEVVFEGFGGPSMEMEGLRSIAHLRDLAVSGFWEVGKRIGYFRNLITRTVALLDSRKPDLFLPVDYPGFNLRVAAAAKARRIPVAWYIAPQLWAWGKNRARHLAEVVDVLLVVFPFEEQFFRNVGIRAVWVGHPMHVDVVQAAASPQPNTLVLMPGSRRQELRAHVPLLRDVMQRLPQVMQSAVDIRVPQARSLSRSDLAPLEECGATIVADAHQALLSSSAGLIKAGTSTLEAALFGVPFATFYRTSSLNYAIAKRVITLRHVTMMNVLLDRTVVHEYLQHQATARALVAEAADLLMNEERRRELAEASNQVRELLGMLPDLPLPADRAAEVIADRYARSRS